MKKTIGVFAIVLGIINLLYFIVCLIVFKMIINFSQFFLILSLVFISFGVFKIKYEEHYIPKYLKIVFRTFKIITLAILVSFIVVEACICINANDNYNEGPDYIMILGSGLRGKTMLLVQLQRTERALEFIKKHPNVKVIVSGGQGKGEDISEAEAIRVYLVNHGVKNENIIKEDKSKTTMENMKYTKDILQKIDGRNNIKIAIVTSNFHVFRAKLLAQRCGFVSEGVSAPIIQPLIPNYYIREYFGVVKSFFMDK